MQVEIHFKPAFLLLLAGLILASLGSASPVWGDDRGSTRQAAGELTIMIGQPCDHPYLIIIPARDFDLLKQLQNYVPDAFLTRSSLGSYIQAGSSQDRASAERLRQQLQEQAFDARVVYHPISCPPQGQIP